MPELTFFNRLSGVHNRPLCAHPAQWALAGNQAYPGGLPDEAFISGRANVQANNYWSSTTNANNTDNAWNVNMYNGNVNANNKTNNNYVWPVRAGEWLPPIFSFENLYRCYLKCRKNKRNTINALKFEINAEENLFKLSEELDNKTYQPSRSVCFIVERPKMREIVAADFRDRVVHHVLIEKLEEIYEPIFIYDSYACRKNRGLHKAVERVREFIRKGSKNGREKLYFVHLDIRNFFMTIDKEILYRMLERKVMDENILWLVRIIIFHNPVDNCIIKGEKNLIKHLPPHKSLFHTHDKNKGLPVGNLTSQFFANVYLNELDQYVKHILKCKYYIRYCDDFLILDKSLERLKEVKGRISEFVTDKLNLSLNDKYRSIMPVSNGIDFLGYIIRQDYMLVRRRVVNNLRSKLNWFKKMLISEQGGIRIIKYDGDFLEKLRSVIASYIGHMKWADTYSLRGAISKRYSFLKEYFSFDDGKVKPLYRYCEVFPSVRRQYHYYANKFRGMVIFFQVGCFYEFYGELRSEVMDILCLKKLNKSQRGVIYGLPVRLENRYSKRLVEEGITVIIIKETDRYIGRIKERLPIMKITKTKEGI